MVTTWAASSSPSTTWRTNLVRQESTSWSNSAGSVGAAAMRAAASSFLRTLAPTPFAMSTRSSRRWSTGYGHAMPAGLETQVDALALASSWTPSDISDTPVRLTTGFVFST